MLKPTFKSFAVYFGQRTWLAVIAAIFVGVVITLIQPDIEPKEEVFAIKVCSSADIDSITKLDNHIVYPVLYQKIPNLKDVHYKQRMQKFIDMMLPSVLMAREKMLIERQRVLELNAALQQGVAVVSDSLYIERVKSKLKEDNINEILKRLQPHPTSIVLAQAAIESGWGTSRFCREANNIYGVWSYNPKEKRIRARESRGDKNIYLRKYDSIFESVYDYMLTIAKAGAYKQFREARLYSDNPYRLIWYLNNYSEMGYEYVRTLRNVIEFNDLHKYDEYTLAKIDKEDPIWKALLR